MQEPTPQDAADNYAGLAESLVLRSEIPEKFAALLAGIEAELQPRTCVEEILVGEIAANQWRRARTRQMEKALMDYEIGCFPCPPDATLPVTQAVLACRWTAGQSGIFDLLGRSETRYARNMAASLRLLLQLRAARPNPPAAVPQPLADNIERKIL